MPPIWLFFYSVVEAASSSSRSWLSSPSVIVMPHGRAYGLRIRALSMRTHCFWTSNELHSNFRWWSSMFAGMRGSSGSLISSPASVSTVCVRITPFNLLFESGFLPSEQSGWGQYIDRNEHYVEGRLGNGKKNKNTNLPPPLGGGHSLAVWSALSKGCSPQARCALPPNRRKCEGYCGLIPVVRW